MMQVEIAGIGVIGPGLADWQVTKACLRGERPWIDSATEIPAPAGLPATERRRVGSAVKIAMGVAQQLFDSPGVFETPGFDGSELRSTIDPATTPVVFASSGGDGLNCHLLCEALAEPQPQVSPTRFTNSVHNAPSGYWSIASGNIAAAASLSGFDGSFATGLIEAALLADTDRTPVLFVAYDVPYPAPLDAARPLGPSFAVALLLQPSQGHSMAPSRAHAHEPTHDHAQRLTQARLNSSTLRIEGYVDADHGAMTMALPHAGLEALRRQVPAARALPLLLAIAKRRSGILLLETPGARALAVTLECH